VAYVNQLRGVVASEGHYMVPVPNIPLSIKPKHLKENLRKFYSSSLPNNLRNNGDIFLDICMEIDHIHPYGFCRSHFTYVHSYKRKRKPPRRPRHKWENNIEKFLAK
jgi:hypothetical protein